MKILHQVLHVACSSRDKSSICSFLFSVFRLSRFFLFIISMFGFGCFGIVVAEVSKIRSLFGIRNRFALALFMFGGSLLLGVVLFTWVEGMSVEDALWFSYTISTTLGFVDIPIDTDLGKVCVVFYALLTLGPTAYVTGVISNVFREQLNVKDVTE